jgi:hypothetical protein
MIIQDCIIITGSSPVKVENNDIFVGNIVYSGHDIKELQRVITFYLRVKRKITGWFK